MQVVRASVAEYGGTSPGARAGTAAASERAGLLLRITTKDGIVAQGESSPLPGYSPDTLAEARRELDRLDWDRIPEPVAGIDARALLRDAGERQPIRSPAARFAVETALLHVLGVRAGRPVCQLLADSDIVTPVSLSVFVGTARNPEVVSAARRAVEHGAPCIKVKIEDDPRRDMPVLESVRRAISGVPLRLDANQSLDRVAAPEILQALASLEPEWVEEPLPSDALTLLAAPPVPIALDESLQEPGAWETLSPHLERLRCIGLVLKPMTLGGFSACLELAARAATRGLAVSLSHSFDGPVALAAAAHLAFAIASRTHASGIPRHAGLAAWPTIEIPFIGDTHVTRPELPGLGIACLGGNP